MLVLDTSGIIALADRNDRNHARARSAYRADKGPLIVPTPICAEIAYMLEARMNRSAASVFVQRVEAGDFLLDCCDDDFGRADELMQRYGDLPLDLPDAIVVACAERNGGSILTTDRRDFDVVARGEGTITLVP